MKRSARISFLLLATLCACSKPPQSAAAQPKAAPAAQTQRAEPPNPDFIGRVWVSTSPGSARGSILVFLPDRTLLMDSCFETFRLSQWGVAGDRIRWIEDTIPIEAEVSLPNKNELRLHIAGRDREQTYVAASLPYVCPDMPR
jgi:hypothetical protein